MAKKQKTHPSSRTALIVLGMHRSGTSALSGVLAQMGADLPRALMEPDEINPKGFFESTKLTYLNEELLGSAGHRWFSYNPVPSDWFASPTAAEFLERAVEVIHEEYGRSRLFVMKDPRVCRLLPFWHKALAEAGCTPVHVCTHRHPLDVAASLNRWANYETEYALLLWLRHVLEAEAASRGQARMFTSYERLMTDWVDVVTQVGSTLNLKWPRNPKSAFKDVQDFLTKDLQHFPQSTTEVGRLSALPEGVAETFEILEGWASDGENCDDYERLDRLRKAIEEASATVGSAIWHNQEQHLRIDILNKRISELEVASAEAEATAATNAESSRMEQLTRTAAQARVGELAKALSDARDEVRKAQMHKAEEAQARTAAQARVGELEKEIETERAGAREDIASREAKAAELSSDFEKRIEALQREYDALERVARSSESENDQLRSKLAQKRAEADDYHEKFLEAGRLFSNLKIDFENMKNENDRNTKRSNLEKRHLTAMTRFISTQLSETIELKLQKNNLGIEAGRVSQTRANELEKALTDTRNELQKVQAHKAEEAQARTAAQARVGELEKALTDTRDELQKVQTHKAKEAQARTSAQARVGELEKALATAKKEMQSLQEKNAAEIEARKVSEGLNQALLGSTTWRMTEPIRRIVRIFHYR
ncbi:MAG: sulfotransferase [Jhaorihella sp.]